MKITDASDPLLKVLTEPQQRRDNVCVTLVCVVAGSVFSILHEEKTLIYGKACEAAPSVK